MEKQRMRKITDISDLASKIGRLYTIRTIGAWKTFQEHVQDAIIEATPSEGMPLEDPWNAFTSYAFDFVQRSVLFWDCLRQRGNNFIEHVKEGAPPLLAFKWETISDGRTFPRPVNYALVRIIPPEGVIVDDTKRPFIIVDPRASPCQGPT